MKITEVKNDPVELVFDKHNGNWSPKPEYCQLWLRATTNFLYDRLRVKEHLFLNEALETFEFPITQEGCVLGWMSDDAVGKITYEQDGPNRWKIRLEPDGIIADKI